MSHLSVKTTYNVEGPFASTETRTLYAYHNNSNDITTFFDEDGKVLFLVQDWHGDTIVDAINRLMSPEGDTSLNDGVELMNADDRKRCGMGS